MDPSSKVWTLGEIAKAVSGELHGPSAQAVSRPVPAGTNDPQGITFASSTKFLDLAEQSTVGAILVSNGFLPVSKPYILVPDSRAAFGRLLALWKRPLPLTGGVHPAAIVSPNAQIASTAQIGAYAVVEDGAQIGERALIYPFAYVGQDCDVGEDCVLYPHAVLYQSVKVGRGSVIHAGAVLGADGFGFEWNGAERVKVPQIGNVELGADVEVGANSCIDRATAGTTTLDQGVKIDNLVQIGHNATIGAHTVIAAQTGLSGSTKVGKRVMMGGAVATSHHVAIADDVTLGGRTGVTSDIDASGEYWGTPARPMMEAMRAALALYKVPDLLSRVRELEARLKELEKE